MGKEMSPRNYFKMQQGSVVSATLALCSMGNWQTGATAPERCFTLPLLSEMQLSAHVISYSCLKLLFNQIPTKNTESSERNKKISSRSNGHELFSFLL